MMDIKVIPKPKPQAAPARNFPRQEEFYAPPRFNFYAPPRPARRKFPFAKIFLWIIVTILAAGIFYGGFVAYKVYATSKKINPAPENAASSIVQTIKSFATADPVNLKNENGRINVLLLGIGGKGNPGQNLTDTIMIANIDTKTNRVGLFSIPRDLYVEIPGTTISTKINSVYQYGLSANNDNSDAAAKIIESEITDITSLNIDYYVVLNFDGFRSIIDSVGGINITSDRDILDTRYPGSNYSYETFQLSKGFHHLDGATALKYARERHDDPEGDFGRAKRQQQIMQAAKSKIFSAGTLFNPFAVNHLFDSLGDNIKTDITPGELGSFYELMKKLDTNNINNVVVDAWNKDSLLKVSHVQYGPVRAFVLVPRVGNYSEIQQLAQNILDLNKLKRRKDEIANEDALVAIVNESGDDQLINKIRGLLQESFNYKNVIILNSPDGSASDKTVAYDLTSGAKPFTLDELATKLPATVSYSLDPSLTAAIKNKNPDIIISLGKDLIDKYNMTEDSVDDLNKSRDDQMYLNLLDNTNNKDNKN